MILSLGVIQYNGMQKANLFKMKLQNSLAWPFGGWVSEGNNLTTH